VSFVRLHERDFGVPVCRFMRALCEYYGAELHNFSPNSISQAAVFVTVCEGYLKIEAHWDLWIHLFRGEHFVENARGQPKRFARAGGLTLHVRPYRKNLYIPSKMTTNNTGWNRGWFYLQNYSGVLPAFTNRVLRERPAKWDWGVSPPTQQAKLGVLIDALALLAKKGLMAAAVIANFHRQRVIPLMERALPIFKLIPGAQASGSRTAVELLPCNTAARRARYAVADFPNDPEDLWRIKMRPEPGYISLVSFDSESVVCLVRPLSSPLTLSRLYFAGVEVPLLEAPSPGGTPNQPPARREVEEAEGRGGGKGREEEEAEGETRQGVQDYTLRGEVAACHARVHGRGGGGFGCRGPPSGGRRGGSGCELPAHLSVGCRRGGAGSARRNKDCGGVVGGSVPRGGGAGVVPSGDE